MIYFKKQTNSGSSENTKYDKYEKKSKSGHIIFKLQKIKDKEFFKEVREEKVTYREAA